MADTFAAAPNPERIVRALEFSAVVSGACLAALVTILLVASSQLPVEALDRAILGAIAGLCSAAALGIALRKRGRAAVGGATLVYCVLFSAIALAVSGALIVLRDAHPYLIGRLAIAVCISAVGGALPVGGFWTVVFLKLMRTVGELREEPNLAAIDTAVVVIGATYAAVCGLCAWLCLPSIIIAATFGAFAAAGLIAALIGESRRAARRRWLEDVHRGDIEGWQILPLSAFEEELMGLPSTDIEQHNDAVLVRAVRTGGDGAYRDGGFTLVPWARTPG